MARLIDADALMLKARWMEEPDGSGIPCDLMAVSTIAIKNAPTVDAVEVVRCKDCKHYELIPMGGRPMCTKFLGLTLPKEEDFCSYGERRTDVN